MQSENKHLFAAQDFIESKLPLAKSKKTYNL